MDDEQKKVISYFLRRCHCHSREEPRNVDSLRATTGLNPALLDLKMLAGAPVINMSKDPNLVVTPLYPTNR